MKIVTWSIINNEIDFIADIIDHHLKCVDYIYVLDTGSTDGTLEYLQNKTKTTPNLIVEEYNIKYTPEYDVPWEQMKNPFPEVEVRNYAICRCKELCNPDWMIQLDGDEIFLETVRNSIYLFPNAVALNHSTINPACDLKTHRKEFRFGHNFLDPHSRVWNAKYAIEYIKSPKWNGKQYHCIPSVKGWNKHLFEIPGTVWVKENFHLHLHWVYGKKIENFFRKSGTVNKTEIIKKVPLNEFSNLLPKNFLQKRKSWEKD